MMPLGKVLKKLRKERGLSQNKLAMELGINSSTIALYETGDRTPSLQILIELSRLFGVSTDYLLGIGDQQNVFLDVTDLTQKQISSLNLIIENYREANYILKINDEVEI